MFDDDATVLEIHGEWLNCLSWLDENRALAKARETLQRWPNDLHTLMYLYVAGRLETEVADWKARLDPITPVQPMDIFMLVTLLVHAERLSDALSLLEAHRELAFDNRFGFQWHQLAAQIHRSMGNPQAAADVIDQFSANQPLQQEKLWVNHYLALGDFAAARPFAVQIAEAEGSLEAQYVAYTVLGRLSDWAACERYAHRMVEMVPNDQTYMMLAHAQFRGGKPLQVIETVKTARTNGIDSWLLDDLLGTSYLAVGDFQSATDALEKAYRIAREQNRELGDLRRKLAQCSFNRIGKLNRGIQLMEEQIESAAASPNDFIELAQCYQSEWRLDEAYETLRRAKMRFPQDEAVAANHIILGYQTDHEAEASQAAAEFAQTFPNSNLLRAYQQEEAIQMILAGEEQVRQVLEHYLEGVFPRLLFSLKKGMPFALETFASFSLNEERDAYPKFFLYTTYGIPDEGANWLREHRPRQIVIDYTALLTLFALDLFPQLAAAFDKMYLSNALPSALNYERYQLANAQLGRYKRQREVQNAISGGKIQVDRTLKPGEGLEQLEADYGRQQLGFRLARLFQLADRLDALCFCASLPNHDTAPEAIRNRWVGMGDVLKRLVPRDISENRRQEVLRHFPPSPEREPSFDTLLRDATLIADQLTLESLAAFGLLTPFLRRFEGRIRTPDWEADLLHQEIRAFEMRQNIHTKLTNLQPALAEHSETFCVAPLAPDEDVIRIPELAGVSDVDEIYHQLFVDGFNLSIKHAAPLVTDDRASRRLRLDELTTPTCGVLDLIEYLRHSGHLSAEVYRQKYLKLLEWNALFLPLDPTVARDVLVEAVNAQELTQDARVLRQYYSACFADAGLSKKRFDATFDSEAIRFFTHHSHRVAQLLCSIWNDERLDISKKQALSRWIRHNLWKAPELFQHWFPDHPAALHSQALQKWSILLEAGRVLDDSTHPAFAQWFYNEWLQSKWLIDPDSKPHFLDFIYEQFMRHEPPEIFAASAITFAKICGTDLWSEVIAYEPIRRRLQEQGVQIEHFVHSQFGAVSYAQFQRWYFDAVERAWCGGQQEPMRVRLDDREIEVAFFELEGGWLLRKGFVMASAPPT